MRGGGFIAWGWAISGLLLASVPVTQTAVALQSDTDQDLQFDIAAQALDAALARYFRMTGVQLLYDSALTRGRRSTEVHGSFPRRRALLLLLEGTGLTARYSRSRAVVLVPVARRTADPDPSLIPLDRVLVREGVPVAPPPPDPCFNCYYHSLERDLEHELSRNPGTAGLSFDIVLALRIGRDGRIVSLKVERGSGAPLADRHLTEALAGITVTRPPAGLRMPLVIVLNGKTSTATAF